MEKQIIVQVSVEGDVKIDAVGFRGSSCKQATAALERALGDAKSFKPKPEMFQQQAQQQTAGL